MMKTLKSISIFFLLIVLTCGVVFMPQIISGQKEDNILNEVIHLNYTVGNRPKLTSEQVALLYFNREVGAGYNSSVQVNDQSYASQVNLSEFVELLFGKDETICTPIKELLTSSTMGFCSRNSSLVKIDNQPTALNFIECGRKSDPYFNIKYEEKTKTIINFDCGDFLMEFENIEDSQAYLEKTSLLITDYYENQLNISEKQYYCNVQIPEVTEKNTNQYIAIIQINCGLIQEDDKIFYIEGESEVDSTYKFDTQ